MNRILQIAAVAAVLATSVGLSRLDPSDIQVRGARNITVVTTDFAFSSPTVINAGWTTVNLVNRGSEPHQVQIARLEPGKTFDDVTAAVRNKTEPPWRLVGGPNAADPNGGRANATQYLAPGNYLLVCFIPSPDGKTHLEKGMVRPLRVRATGSARGREPAADVSMRLVDYGFDLSRPLRPGRQTIRVWTDAPQPHEVVLVELAPGKTTQDFLHWAESPAGPPPVKFAGGVVFLHPREAAYFTVNLKRGQYGLICFYPDRKDGKPHFMHGMVSDITVE
jgi:hypothetical protein